MHMYAYRLTTLPTTYHFDAYIGLLPLTAYYLILTTHQSLLTNHYLVLQLLLRLLLYSSLQY